jgi:hypothetical protein
MDKYKIATDVLNRLINTKSRYDNPIRACLEAVLARYEVTLTPAETSEIYNLVETRLRRLARK